jgi:hypothetical protein
MKATKFLSACSMVCALMMVAPALAQNQELLTQEDEEQELLTQEQELLTQKEAENRAASRAKRAEQLGITPLDVPFVVRQVAVECFGECTDSTLATICGSGWTPIAVDCQDVQEWTGGPCGDVSDNRCARFTVLTTDRLSDYCDDINGWDANVYCAQ